MIDFFTDPYKDELIYSAIARYHFYSGNTDFRDTIEECFGKRTMVPTFELGCRLEYLAKELGANYTSQRIIHENTIFPYYEHFIDKKRKLEILSYIKLYGRSSIYTRLGIVAGSICKKDGICYCPICAKQDIEMYGEPYIHREHQLEGIILCPHHGILLENYSLKKIDVSRVEYIRLEEKDLNFEINNAEIADYDKHLKLAKDSYYILTANLREISRDKVFKKYRYLLYKKGLLKGNDTINQRELYKQLTNYYGKAFLKQLACEIVYENEYNWLKVISRKSKRASHPLRNLLFINFLCSDIRDFFENIEECQVTNINNRNQNHDIENTDLKKLNSYKDIILQAKEKNKGLCRTELRKECKKEYIYIYRYDKKWLFNNLPSKIAVDIHNKRVDWNKRDEEYLKLLKEKYSELINDENMIRITKGSLSKALGILSNVEKKLEHLPLTKKFFNEVCEKTRDFQFRRCKFLIDKSVGLESDIKLWKIQKEAGVRKNDFDAIRFKVLNYINQRK
ncbi:TniQ family protein [Clostridium botulinum]|uniref:TnsD family Tn7-like transposition protein n=1 Tax=Clostridium botulinum TaxID=1491 RepID=UPI002245C40B|nr:TnsD family Tn7-like transposition protein [Clostridium botulinum]UZP03731.1 TniQ family protein [Clostridium botulinum]UZP07087.1 TniQ family protein [Clostridium botulinum]UZP10469.1 TniQ family protein [Clostridium botulinum]